MVLIGGLPAHILLVHGVVVFGPLAGLGAVVYGLAGRTRRYLAWPLGVLALVLAPLALVAAATGEQLQATRGATDAIQAHARQGDILKMTAVVFFFVVVLMLAATVAPLAERIPALAALQRSRPARIASLALGVLAGLFVMYQSVITGHSGSFSVWGG
ncbi:hypothetical protein [Arthrobacter globiformis]|uniref:hypothetical protein n=1 Tax=Arthrobacter globiformis TaxID=1665 RepID=UPI00278F733A|nr:hypothetical protein [Arthrobacter globiformis]MDQ0620161.1 hypothetical protein [Arthrobacter globiformis]